MKIVFSLVTALLLASGTLCHAGEWAGFDDGFRAAAANGRPVIVDFSAEWCGWCKKMEKEVFSRPDVATRLASETVTVRIDVDSPSLLTYKGARMTAGQLATQLRVSGLPTLLVFSPKGDRLAELVGFVDAKTFLRFLDYLKQKKYASMSFDAYLRSGPK